MGEDENGNPSTAPLIIRRISRKQARITYNPEADTYYIEDCSTKGNTRVNKDQLGIFEKRPLKAGDRLTLGESDYAVVFQQES